MDNKLMNDMPLKFSYSLLLLFLFLAAGCKNVTIKSSQPEVITYRNDDGFSFDLPVNCRDVTLGREPVENYSVIYLCMKNNHSDVLYELKAVCESEEQLPEVQGFIEKVALTARFNVREMK